jgi:arylsulfatase A-like enzyme
MAGAAGLAACAAKAPALPNVILVMADDLGYGHLGCYGQKIIQTPNIDRLAAGGMRFTGAYAGCTVCGPSRSALMTGQHTGHTPVRTNGGGAALPASAVTVAEILQAAGYATGLFGKWGLGLQGTEGSPLRQGFDEYLGPLHQVHAQYYYPDHLWRNDERFPLEGNSFTSGRQYAPDVIQEAALEFVRRNHERPFFLYLPSQIPHHEFQAPAETLAQYEGRFAEEPFIRNDRGFTVQEHPAAHFAGMVTRLDQHVGQVMDLLAELQIEENTLVLFTSDNGSIGDAAPITNSFGGTGALRGYKRDLYEGGIRVPLIAWRKGTIVPGTVSHLPCASWDFFPTFAEMAGAPPPDGIDGISILPELTGGKQQAHEFLYWESGGQQAVRMGDWKAVRPSAEAALELYDLLADVRERNDIAEENPEVAATIAEYLANCRTEPPLLAGHGWGDGPVG